MRKLLALTLTLVLTMGLFACGNEPASGDPSAKEDAPATFSDGWRRDGNGHYLIEDVWDSAVLPACVPEQMDGLTEIMTGYKSAEEEFPEEKNSYGMYMVGNLQFEDANYQSWSLSFVASQRQQMNDFATAVAANGFYGGVTKELDSLGRETYEWVGNGYYAFFHVYNTTDDAGNTHLRGTFIITPIRERVKSFFGTALPTAGVDLFPYLVESDRAMEEFWNPADDTGTLPARYLARFSYFGLTPEDAQAYVQQLTENGWTITEEDGAVWLLQKGDNEFCQATYAYSGDAFVLALYFADAGTINSL